LALIVVGEDKLMRNWNDRHNS